MTVSSKCDRSVSEGLSAELSRVRNWWGKGKSMDQHWLHKWHCNRLMKHVPNSIVRVRSTLDLNWETPYGGSGSIHGQIVQTELLKNTTWPWTGPDLSHTCPNRHVKVQISRNTCQGAYTAKNHYEFERQPTFWDVLETQVRMYFVRPLRMYRTWECSKQIIVL